MKNTLIASIVAILCTIAICITYGVCAPKADEKTVAEYGDYVTEAEAADYLGVTEEIMQLMREKLKYLEGTYMEYMYVNDGGEEVTIIVYNKEDLSAKVSELQSKNGILNFKFIQDNAAEAK